MNDWSKLRRNTYDYSHKYPEGNKNNMIVKKRFIGGRLKGFIFVLTPLFIENISFYGNKFDPRVKPLIQFNCIVIQGKINTSQNLLFCRFFFQKRKVVNCVTND